MNKRVLVYIVVLVALCAIHEISFGDGTQPITISQLNDHLYLIPCIGGQEFGLPPYEINVVASVGPDGILLVDAGFGSTGQALRDTLRTLGDGAVKMIINTHYHGDHTLGNHFFKGTAPIIAQQNAITALSGRFFNLPGKPDQNQPNVGFTDSLIILFNGEEIHVVHGPHCHTQGDVYVYFTGSKIVAVGDLMFPGEIPYIDLPDHGSVEGYIKQVKKFIYEFPDDVTFIPGHGPYYTKSGVREYYTMLTETANVIKDAAATGETAGEMIERNLLAGWSKWTGRFPTTSLEAWIQTVHYEVVDIQNAKPSICGPLTTVLANGSGRDAVQEFHRLKSTRPDAYEYGEADLNALGYQLLARNRLDDAVEIFKLNVEQYPSSFNVYDSYGEILMTKGDTAQSIRNYEKSLELNPGNTNAVEILKRLRPAE